MKIQLNVLLLLSTSIITFSFWKFEGPFIIKQPSIRANRHPSTIRNVLPKLTYTLPKRVNPKLDYKKFYYDHNTKYVLFGLSNPETTNLIENSTSISLKKQSFLIKYPLLASHQGGYSQMSITLMLRCMEFLKRKKFLYKTNSFITSSGVCINNNDNNITLIKGEKIVDLQRELKKYFDNYYDNQKIIDAIHYGRLEQAQKDPDQLKIVDNVNQASKKLNLFDKKINILNLLDRSTILNVFAVLVGSSGKKSVLCGVAKDNYSDEKFFWVTDLKQDISILFNQ